MLLKRPALNPRFFHTEVDPLKFTLIIEYFKKRAVGSLWLKFLIKYTNTFFSKKNLVIEK